MCVSLYKSLLVRALHPVAMMTPFFIRTIIVGLSSGSASDPLTLVKICQVNFFCVRCDHRILRTSRQQTLKFLHEIKSLKMHARIQAKVTFLQTGVFQD